MLLTGEKFVNFLIYSRRKINVNGSQPETEREKKDNKIIKDGMALFEITTGSIGCHQSWRSLSDKYNNQK